jgi:hypothetical protein
VRDLIDLDEATVAQVIRAQAAALKNPATSPAQVLERLRGQGLTHSVAVLQELLED